MWALGQIPTSTFSRHVTLGQFLNCSGLPFFHLLMTNMMLLLPFSLVQCEDEMKIPVYQGPRIVRGSIRRRGSYYWIFNPSLLKWTLSGPQHSWFIFWMLWLSWDSINVIIRVFGKEIKICFEGIILKLGPKHLHLCEVTYSPPPAFNPCLPLVLYFPP